jgi:hypothetical protein
MTEGVEESRRKRTLPCNGADRARESGEYPALWSNRHQTKELSREFNGL